MENKAESSQMERSNSGSAPVEDFANKFRRLRACARCHRLKMRCVFQDPAYNSCRRCYASGIMCSMTEDPTEATARLRPRKKTKVQSNEPGALLQNAIEYAYNILSSLKKEVEKKDKSEDEESDSKGNQSTRLVKAQSQLSELQHMFSHLIAQSRGTRTKWASSINSMKEGPVKSVPRLPFIPYQYNIIKELIALQILTREEAATRYESFVNDLLCYWPCVSLPSNYNFEYLLENEPLVLLGFISVTCLNDPELHDTLLYYLDRNLAQRVSITGDITVSLIQVYIVLSLWCSPPRKWGSYKHQMSLLTALNLTLCLDLGNEHIRTNSHVLESNSEERKMVRAFVGVYSCCGSLGLSLPRFKVVQWTPHHENCCRVLLMGETNRSDRFLCYYARLISIGQEIFDFLCPDGVSPSHDAQLKKDPTCLVEPCEEIWQSSSLPHDSLRAIMISYEKKMQQCASESELFTQDSKERNLLSIIYYQLLMTMYDYVVCRVLSKKDMLTEVYMQTLSRLIRASEKVIDSFVSLTEQTPNFPTFFYYRPMHALVSLIRSRLLVRSQRLDLEVNVEREYERVSNALKALSKSSLVASKMSVIMTRVEKWMKVSNKFTKDGANNSMVTLLDELGKEKAIETLKAPNKIQKDKPKAAEKPKPPAVSRFVNYNVTTVPARPHKRARANSSASAEESPNDNPNPAPIGESVASPAIIIKQETVQSDNLNPAPIGTPLKDRTGVLAEDLDSPMDDSLEIPPPPIEQQADPLNTSNVLPDREQRVSLSLNDFDYDKALGELFTEIEQDVINYFPDASPISASSKSEEFSELDDENSRRYSMFPDAMGTGFW